jgi:hypothetical protein
VRVQYGAVTLLAVTVGQDGYDCRFQDVPRLTLQTCLPAQVLPARSSAVLQPPPTSQPEAVPTPVEVIVEQGVQQTQALLPEAQKDLQALPSLNQYDLSLQLNPDHTFQGQMDLHYTNSETDTLKSLYFRLFPNGGASYGNGSLHASDIMVDGLPAETVLSLSDSALEVSLAQSLAPGDQAQVSMRFEGVVPVDYGGEDTAAYGFIMKRDTGVMVSHPGSAIRPAGILTQPAFGDRSLATWHFTMEITASRRGPALPGYDR